MNTKLKNLKKFVLDTLFPIRCIDCQKEGSWICPNCLSKIIINTEHVCSVCQTNSTPDGRTCLLCKRKSSLDGMIAATNYLDSIISKAIHLFKYSFVQDLHEPLAALMIQAFKQTELPIPDLIIPIALHPRRLRWRGFNQSELLTKIISQNLLPLSEIPIGENILIRHRYTKPQMQIEHRKDRQQNISGAFSVQNPEAIKNKIILLIDDVSTTGATIFEAAKVLKETGAKEVYALIVAHELK